jgi:L-ascorbate metabolism protein UlaG (beta-lactamase superfamily)
MKSFIKLIKMSGLIIAGIIAIATCVGILFLWLSPEFGASLTSENKAEYSKSQHWNGEIFENTIPTSLDIGWKEIPGLLVKQFKSDPNRQPKFDIPVVKIDSLDIANRPDSMSKVTWFGHSAFLIELNGKKLLVDPMFGATPAPHPTLGKNRYSKELPIEIEKMPHIDAIIISHDHYDHLDYGSIQKLKLKTDEFFVPLGVGRHLSAWGIEASRIHELDWWENIEFSGLTLHCTPARHFSGRGLTDRATTLWCSWVIESNSTKLFFSGDSGYGQHFKEIGDTFGGFDFAMVECGQYNEQWSNIHMMPEESVQAALDVKARYVMPIHWGAFTLAFHSWTDPVERFTKAAKAKGISVTTPRIGEAVDLNGSYPNSRWWEDTR